MLNLEFHDWATIVSMFTVLLVFIGTVAGSGVWWLSRRFSELRHLVYSQNENTINKILEKLEYHERHDDDRFSQITEVLLDIRLKNAARYGLDHGPAKTSVGKRT